MHEQWARLLYFHTQQLDLQPRAWGSNTWINFTDETDGANTKIVNNSSNNNLPAHQIQISKLNENDNGNGKENNKRTLSGVIAHETVHSLLENKLGLLKYKLLPSWKNEGYCDFIANESSFNKQKGVKEICNDTENTDIPSFKYFKYRMITEYLFEERKVTLEKFLDEDFDLENINNNLKKKYCAQ